MSDKKRVVAYSRILPLRDGELTVRWAVCEERPFVCGHAVDMPEMPEGGDGKQK